MKRLDSSRVHHGRIAHLHPAGQPTRVGIYVEDALVLVDGPPSLLGALREGELVAFALDGAGALASITREGGPVGEPRPEGDALRWRQAAGGPSRMALLRQRHRVLRELRAWFDARGFVEVDTPVLVRAPSPESVFEPLAVGPDYLITSPEFQLKRLLVGGFERVYRIGPVFRGGELGEHHNPEFTLLEWYRTHADLTDLAADLEGLLSTLAPLADEFAANWPDGAAAQRQLGLARSLRRSLRSTPYRRATVRELFRARLGMELAGVTTAESLRQAALRAGLAEAASLPLDFTAAFSALWVQVEAGLRVEAGLPPEPLLVTEWPAPTASLARLKPDDPTLAERMELYAGGLELANGFAELTDPGEQRRRFLADLDQRRAQGLPLVPLDEAFLGALAEGMPPAAGMALGVDRLVMLLTGAGRIGEVIPFGWEER